MQRKLAVDYSTIRRQLERRLLLREAAVPVDQFLLLCEVASLEGAYAEARRAAFQELLDEDPLLAEAARVLAGQA